MSRRFLYLRKNSMWRKNRLYLMCNMVSYVKSVDFKVKVEGEVL